MYEVHLLFYALREYSTQPIRNLGETFSCVIIWNIFMWINKWKRNSLEGLNLQQLREAILHDLYWSLSKAVTGPKDKHPGAYDGCIINRAEYNRRGQTLKSKPLIYHQLKKKKRIPRKRSHCYFCYAGIQAYSPVIAPRRDFLASTWKAGPGGEIIPGGRFFHGPSNLIHRFLILK